MILENLSLIVAITENTNAIGVENNLLYFIKEDMDFFKKKTYNHSIICGRKTFEGFKIKPLPKRRNIVLTKTNFHFDNVITFDSLEKLLKLIENEKDEEFIVCGGESIYKQLLPYCKKMYITKIEENENVKADSFFPKIDEKIWKIVDEKKGKNKNPKLTFLTYERK